MLGFLECPHCHGDLTLDGAVVRCAARHAFDVARQGYVSLLAGDAASSGDTAAMVAARATFLGAGYYAPIAGQVQAASGGAPPGCVVDLGAGTGYYLAAVLDRVPDRAGIAVDASKHAARRAARAHPRIGALVCDVWRRLPVRTGAAGLVLDVFAPRHGAEIRRILTPGGTLVVVTPTTTHLAELVPALDLLTVDERKQQRLDDQLGAYCMPSGSTRLEYPMELGHQNVEALVGMGPSAWHADAARLGERIGALPEPVVVTASVMVSTYRRR